MFLLPLLALCAGVAAEFKYKLDEAPGLFERCNITASCPYDSRDHHSLDFLCCEDANWVAPHIFHPMFIFMFTGDVELSLLIPYLFEVFEFVTLLCFRSFLYTTTNPTDMETLAGSLFADAFLGGTLGVVLGALLCRLTGFRSPLQGFRRLPGWMVAKYYGLLALFEACFLCISIPSSTDQHWGLLITGGAISLVLLVVWRAATSSKTDVEAVWGSLKTRDQTLVGFLLIAWSLISQNSGLHYAANDYFQVWAVALLDIAVLLVALRATARSRAARERKRLNSERLLK